MLSKVQIMSDIKCNLKTTSPKSPKFMKPFELFMLRKKRKISSPGAVRKKLIISPLKCIDVNSPNKSKNVKTPEGKKISPKRRSPKMETFCFPNCIGKSPRRKITKRKLNFTESNANKIKNINLFDEETNIEPPSFDKQKTGNGNEDDNNDLKPDWSLRTRIRFVSNKQFPFKGLFSATENAIGTTSFVRCLDTNSQTQTQPSQQPLTTFSNALDDQTADTNLNISTLLKKHCFVWIHPHLPGLDLFPRANKKGLSIPANVNQCVGQDLLNEYCISFKSLYDLVKSKQCSYFYLCGDSFTALFLSKKNENCDDIVTLICPTTEGFRRKLKQEGITFAMPFLEEIDGKENEGDQFKSKSCAIENEEDASIFLESLGVSLEDSSSFSHTRRSKSNESSIKRESTLVLVKGVYTQELVPFLSNKGIVISNSGPFANVPPTLVAPVAFEGACLKSLKLKKNTFDIKVNSVFNFEINGPLLPDNIRNLTKIFRSCCEDLKIFMSSYDYTSAFNSYKSSYPSSV